MGFRFTFDPTVFHSAGSTLYCLLLVTALGKTGKTHYAGEGHFIVPSAMKYRAITENHLYQKTYAKGKKAVGKTVVVYVLRDLHANRLRKENPQKEKINRVGLTVTKKIGGAVTRTRTKRVIREAYRLCDKERNVRKGNLVVLVARDTASRVKSTVVKRDMEMCLEKLNMLLLPSTHPDA